MSVPPSRITFNYKDKEGLDPGVVEALSKFDLTGDGKVSTAELTAGAKAMETLKHQGTFLKQIVITLLSVVVLLLVATFGLTVLAIDLSKETKIEGQAMKTVGGAVVQTAASMPDISIDPRLAVTSLPSGALGWTAAAALTAAVGEQCEHAGTEPLGFRFESAAASEKVSAIVTKCVTGIAMGMEVVVRLAHQICLVPN